VTVHPEVSARIGPDSTVLPQRRTFLTEPQVRSDGSASRYDLDER
jgi:hypothetical protein